MSFFRSVRVLKELLRDTRGADTVGQRPMADFFHGRINRACKWGAVVDGMVAEGGILNERASLALVYHGIHFVVLIHDLTFMSCEACSKVMAPHKIRGGSNHTVRFGKSCTGSGCR